MSRRLMVLAAWLVIAAAAPAQETLVLRRVFVGPTASADETDRELLQTVPDLIFELITSRQPLIRLSGPEGANNRIETSIQRTETGGKRLRMSLLDAGRPELRREYALLPEVGDFEAFAAFLRATAQEMAGALGPVPPEVKISSLVVNVEAQRDLEKIEFAREIDSRPFELTLWSGGLQKRLTGGSGDVFDTRLSPLPVQVDFSAFSHGRMAYALLFNYADVRTVVRNTEVSVDVPYFLCMPGIAFSSRNAQRLGIDTAFGIFAGVAVARNGHSQAVGGTTGPSIHLDPGQTGIFLSTLFKMHLLYSWHIDQNWSIRARTGGSLDLLGIVIGLAGGWSSGRNTAIPYFYPMEQIGTFELVSLGVSYRF